MGSNSEELLQLASELYPPELLEKIRSLRISGSSNLEQMAEFDAQIGGPSLKSINQDGSGNYEIADRDVFRPLQYCEKHFRHGLQESNLEWQARDIVEMSCLHIEALLKRISGFHWLPLGSILRKSIARRKLDEDTYSRALIFSGIFNQAKHNLSHEKDTHLFSVSDAILAYFIARRLAVSLYPLARLKTDLVRFSST